MNSTASHILRVGLGITFIVIGFVVWLAPEAWGSFVQPWAVKFMPGGLVATMKNTAILDIVLGSWMLTNRAVWIPALIATLHLLVILITTTTTGLIIERDIGLFFAALALFFATAPKKICEKLCEEMKK